MNNAQLLALFKEKSVAIDAVMTEDLTIVESPLLAEIIHHAIFQGGKRIRPLLTLLAASLVGPPPPETTRLAISFEYLHAASLLHDDIIDHATLRRGAKTANTIWGMEPVILAGDYLHARAMAVACEAGIACNHGSAEQRLALRTYGTNLGLAFQIIDDLLDYLGDPLKTGKAVGNDFQEGKMTIPLIKTLEQAEDKDHETLVALLKATPQERQEQLPTAHALIEKYQGFVLTKAQAELLLTEALAGLVIFDEANTKAHLTALAYYVLNRDK